MLIDHPARTGARVIADPEALGGWKLTHNSLVCFNLNQINGLEYRATELNKN